MNRRQAAASVFALAMIQPALAEPDAVETALIERLIALVGSSKDVIFVRNGTEATPDAAARHLRDKYDFFRKDINTADDFIRLCGTRSEVTKRPYEVRFSDGHKQPAAVWLGAQLKQMRASKN